MSPRVKRTASFVILGLLFIVSVFIAHGCLGGRSTLVEQFDNGPVGGPEGASEGYIWVREGDNPSPGKHWKRTDPDSLTPDQKKRIRTWP
jgi:hypothetical protein